MNFNDYFELIKNFSIGERNTEKKEMINCNEYKFDNYNLGVIINKYLNNNYEVYLYIEANKDICSRLLYKDFNNESEAKKYFDELSTFAKDSNTETLYLKLLKEKS